MVGREEETKKAGKEEIREKKRRRKVQSERPRYAWKRGKQEAHRNKVKRKRRRHERKKAMGKNVGGKYRVRHQGMTEREANIKNTERV